MKPKKTTREDEQKGVRHESGSHQVKPPSARRGRFDSYQEHDIPLAEALDFLAQFEAGDAAHKRPQNGGGA